jgi:riboflavin synthase
MFTGIIEAIGEVVAIKNEGTNRHFKIDSPISRELKTDQSVSHNGVCLTVTKANATSHWVTAIEETLHKSNLGKLETGSKINLERCMLNNGRFDGHIVQGHVDQTGIVKSVRDRQGSWLFEFEYDPAEGNATVEKGSIAINGISLTCFHSKVSAFTVAIIPYTYEHTNFHQLIGKYVKRLLNFAR